MAIQYSERMRAEEAFKRGFYYGLGFWISGIVLNITAAVLILAVLMGLGLVGAAASRPDRPANRPNVTRPASSPLR